MGENLKCAEVRCQGNSRTASVGTLFESFRESIHLHDKQGDIVELRPWFLKIKHIPDDAVAEFSNAF